MTRYFKKINDLPKNDIKSSIYKAAKEISLWPKWKRDIAGIESDYTITKIDFNKIEKLCEKQFKTRGYPIKEK